MACVETLCDIIADAFDKYAASPALDVEDHIFTYAELKSRVLPLRNVLAKLDSQAEYVGIFAYRSFGVHVAIHAVLLAGYAYMPLNPLFPAERSRHMLRLANCNVVILSRECVDAFRSVADSVQPLTVVYLDSESNLTDEFSQHTFISADNDELAGSINSRNVRPDSPAYLLFTSGSTGVPKGVVISHGSACAYVRHIGNRCAICQDDRVSQLVDTTFDPSVHDIFVAMFGGAKLCVVPKQHVVAPASFIQRKEISIWFSVPSTIMFLERLRLLQPGGFPSLKHSFFCGEPLPARSTRKWQEAALNSKVDNLYGPTEATIAITEYRWNTQTSLDECYNGLVPIGHAFPGHETRVVDDAGKEAPVGCEGELLLSGPQLASGYLNNPEETRKRFIRLEGSDALWYRTGDVVKDTGTECGMVFIGRIDDQVKIRGFRVELGEIDKVLREAADSDMAVAIPMAVAGMDALDSVYGFVEDPKHEVDAEAVIQHCRRKLPEYMVPTRIVSMDRLPINSSGKIDRKGLMKWKM